MKSIYRYSVALLAAAISLCASALATTGAGGAAAGSQPRITAAVTPDSVMIGDRVCFEITVDKDVMQAVMFPTFNPPKPESEGDGTGNEEAPSLECIEELPEDTLSQEGRRVVIRKRYTLAAFDEGRYVLPAQVLYADKNIVDTLYAAEAPSISVATFEIDSTAVANGLVDIKPQKTLRFRFGEISGWLLLALGVVALIALATYLLARYMHRRGRRLADIFRPAPPPPPHVAAISALEELHNRKLWQNNQHKLYYSGLSDILRTYLDGRYGVGAMEMTTDEIVEAIRDVEMPNKCSMNLVAILREADLVKFAKAMPEAEENEENYNRAYFFVEETKPIEEQTDAEGAKIIGAEHPTETVQKGGDDE